MFGQEICALSAENAPKTDLLPNETLVISQTSLQYVCIDELKIVERIGETQGGPRVKYHGVQCLKKCIC